MAGKFPLKLNITTRPIANKYREGKLKRTKKLESKVPEIDKREQLASGFMVCVRLGVSSGWQEVC